MDRFLRPPCNVRAMRQILSIVPRRSSASRMPLRYFNARTVQPQIRSEFHFANLQNVQIGEIARQTERDFETKPTPTPGFGPLPAILAETPTGEFRHQRPIKAARLSGWGVAAP